MCAILPILESQKNHALLQAFWDIIPTTLAPHLKKKEGLFTRHRKLPFPKLLTTIFSLVANGNHHGVDVHLGDFFRDARRSGLWPDAQAPQRSALCKARTHVPWEVFQDILLDAVRIAYDFWPHDPCFTWHGMSVFAIDGSKYTLPATDKLRQEFDPTSGLDHVGKGHYPQCLVSTLYDVFRRLPIARTIVRVNGSEREELVHLLPFVPDNSLLLCDRGYPSYEIFHLLVKKFSGAFVFRCPASSTFPAVEAFVNSGTQEAIIWMTPSHNALRHVSRRQRKHLKALELRVIRLEHPDGTVSVLITNLLNHVSFPREEIIALYFDRWEVEALYKDEKVTLEIEQFHARHPNGIRQELFAAVIMTVISRTMMISATQQFLADGQECQFKNAILTVASEAALLVPHAPEQAVIIFHEVLQEMARVKYYRPPTPRPSQPRINKHPPNKWSTRNRQTPT